MKLSKENKDRIEREFNFVIKKMEESNNPHMVLFYFSGIQTLLNRIMNFEYSEELLFVQFIIERARKEIVTAIESMRQGSQIAVFHEKFGEKLIELTKDLSKGFFNSKTRDAVLKKIVVLAYTCSGNGIYLAEKGVIDIFSETKEIEKKNE